MTRLEKTRLYSLYVTYNLYMLAQIRNARTQKNQLGVVMLLPCYASSFLLMIMYVGGIKSFILKGTEKSFISSHVKRHYYSSLTKRSLEPGDDMHKANKWWSRLNSSCKIFVFGHFHMLSVPFQGPSF